jgi:hypothetical protein
MGGSKSMRGPYEHVNRRLVDLARAPWISVEDVAARSPTTSREPVAASDESPLPTALVRDEDRRPAYASLRDRHAGAVVTSYTRLKGTRDARSAWSQEVDTRRLDKAAQAVDELAETTLRAARSSGVFLHELLERVPLDSFAAAGSLESWRARPEVASLIEEAIAVHRVPRSAHCHGFRRRDSRHACGRACRGAAGFNAPGRSAV